MFIVLQSVPGLLRAASSAGAAPEFWIYPLQTILCAALLIRFRRAYPTGMNATGAVIGLVVGIFVFGLWISPQAVFHAAPRLAGGFNPHQIPPWAGAGNVLFTAVVLMRFARLVLVVPAIEEIFWRGCLLRYLKREDFTKLPFGDWTPFSFGIVTLGFTFEHSRPDWPAALVTGVLYNLVAIRTRSLPACFTAHAVTNLLLGIYIMQTHQWGFW